MFFCFLPKALSVVLARVNCLRVLVIGKYSCKNKITEKELSLHYDTKCKLCSFSLIVILQLCTKPLFYDFLFVISNFIITFISSNGSKSFHGH